MGSGKTTVGKVLAKKLQRRFIDLDAFIENRYEKPIKSIFAESGEQLFRSMESECLKEVSEIKDECVISTGGGVVLSQLNWDLMSASGKTIYLKGELGTIWKRIRNGNKRPLLKVKNPWQEAKKLFKERKELYEKADFTVKSKGLTVQKVTDEIISIIKNHA